MSESYSLFGGSHYTALIEENTLRSAHPNSQCTTQVYGQQKQQKMSYPHPSSGAWHGHPNVQKRLFFQQEKPLHCHFCERGAPNAEWVLEDGAITKAGHEGMEVTCDRGGERHPGRDMGHADPATSKAWTPSVLQPAWSCPGGCVPSACWARQGEEPWWQQAGAVWGGHHRQHSAARVTLTPSAPLRVQPLQISGAWLQAGVPHNLTRERVLERCQALPRGSGTGTR